jgi:uncharacterized protein YndB with AHSA1/START domain
MENNSLFNLTLDKPAQTVVITMEFEAERPMVWDAFTKPEILDQWYAPHPFKSRTKYMNFEVGGKRFYAMVSPEGAESWALQQYTSITPITNFKFFNVFADKDENPLPPGSDWDLSFTEANGMTTVTISIYNESLERLERLLEGFSLGMAAMYENLKALLAASRTNK